MTRAKRKLFDDSQSQVHVQQNLAVPALHALAAVPALHALAAVPAAHSDVVRDESFLLTTPGRRTETQQQQQQQIPAVPAAHADAFVPAAASHLASDESFLLTTPERRTETQQQQQQQQQQIPAHILASAAAAARELPVAPTVAGTKHDLTPSEDAQTQVFKRHRSEQRLVHPELDDEDLISDGQPVESQTSQTELEDSDRSADIHRMMSEVTISDVHESAASGMDPAAITYSGLAAQAAAASASAAAQAADISDYDTSIPQFTSFFEELLCQELEDDTLFEDETFNAAYDTYCALSSLSFNERLDRAHRAAIIQSQDPEEAYCAMIAVAHCIRSEGIQRAAADASDDATVTADASASAAAGFPTQDDADVELQGEHHDL
jgi:hypothetical protein